MPAGGPFIRTPNRSPLQEPFTPAKDPSSIDRRGLVGVGELTTPRWTRTEQADEPPIPDLDERDVPEDEDEPDSPWTIEAVDGEMSDKEEVCCSFTTLTCFDLDLYS